jgi:predicted transcriptional regulator of viral defense system
MSGSKRNYLTDFIIDLQSKGRYSFSLPELRSSLSVGDEALKQALRRLVLKNRICPVRRNFYVVIPPEYIKQRILPPALFIDALMRFINRPYYAGLLSAAALHGAAHQQPQEFFIVTVKPALRRVSVRGVVINFVVRKRIDGSFVVKKQTETGFLAVSGPELTAMDCVYFPGRIGGFDRAAEIIRELLPVLTRKGLRKLAKADFPKPVLQRLGFLLDMHPGSRNLSDALFESLAPERLKSVMLVPAGEKKSGPVNRWKIIENVKLEIDE